MNPAASQEPLRIEMPGFHLLVAREYEARANSGALPVYRGHLLTREDRIVRQHILNIMCHFETSWERQENQFPQLQNCLLKLAEMENYGLLELSKNKLVVPEHARPFLRNICMAFDLRLMRDVPESRVFSMTI